MAGGCLPHHECLSAKMRSTQIGLPASSVTSIRHCRPGFSAPSKSSKICPVVTVASFQAALSSGRSEPISSGRCRPPWWM